MVISTSPINITSGLISVTLRTIKSHLVTAMQSRSLGKLFYFLVYPRGKTSFRTCVGFRYVQMLIRLLQSQYFSKLVCLEGVWSLSSWAAECKTNLTNIWAYSIFALMAKLLASVQLTNVRTHAWVCSVSNWITYTTFSSWKAFREAWNVQM